jgi:Lipocalin-like domain
MGRVKYVGTIIIFLFTTWISGWNLASGQVIPLSDTAKRFIGTWQLISITSAGQKDPNRGSHPIGLIYYDGTGHMAVQIMPDRLRPKYAGTEPTPDEAKVAITGYTAYFGTYTINEEARTVTHHRIGNINPGGLGDFVRRYEFAPGDRLILRPLESMNELTWERIK